MGSPSFACSSLQGLCDLFSDSQITVFSRTDKPVKRSDKLVATPVKKLALSLNLTVKTPVNKTELEKEVMAIQPDLIVVVAYGMILPQSITDTFFCINGHGSILPAYRGASPIQASLLNQDTETGITLIRMNEKMDAGDILAISKCPIYDHDHLGDLTSKLSLLCAQSLVEFLKNHPTLSQADLTPQFEDGVSYCTKINSTDLALDGMIDPFDKLAKIKAFSPKPGAYMTFYSKRLKILKATVIDGQLLPKLVQPEGKKPMSFHDFCLGNPKAKKYDF